MTESVLLSTKKVLGLAEDYTAFDRDVIMHINTALNVLTQLGIGPEEGMQIVDETTLWTDILSDSMFNTARSYVYLRVRLLFDPPGTSFLLKALEDQLRELEWRMSVYRESYAWQAPVG